MHPISDENLFKVFEVVKDNKRFQNLEKDLKAMEIDGKNHPKGINLKSDLCQMGYFKNDEFYFYSQLLNGSSGYLIYYFCFDLIDENFVDDKKCASKPLKRKHDDLQI